MSSVICINVRSPIKSWVGLKVHGETVLGIVGEYSGDVDKTSENDVVFDGSKVCATLEDLRELSIKLEDYRDGVKENNELNMRVHEVNGEIKKVFLNDIK